MYTMMKVPVLALSLAALALSIYMAAEEWLKGSEACWFFPIVVGSIGLMLFGLFLFLRKNAKKMDDYDDESLGV